MKMRNVWAAVAPLVLALALFGVSAPGSARAEDLGPRAVAACPAPETLEGVEVCVDRGEGAVYYEGDPITVCATVNLPVIAIFPPPPAPSVRVTGSVDGGMPRVLLDDSFGSGRRCLTNTIAPPLGRETIRLEVSGPATFLFAETHYTSLPRTQSPASFPALTLAYADAQGPGSARITPQGPDPASGGTAIAITLTQNGIDYTGRGFVRPGELGGYVLDATIAAPTGERYHLSGTLMHDQDRVRWRGAGRWWATWDRSITGVWQVAGGPFAEPTP